jgi:hypothetical protein
MDMYKGQRRLRPNLILKEPFPPHRQMAAALSSLPLDIFHRVLVSLPNFETLQCAILSSKPMYSVFATHPRSVAKAIAFNVVGPALPSALSLIRYMAPEDP